MAEAGPVHSTEFSPLQVPEVLKKIFEGSSVNDLKEFRKVCQSWNLESSKVLSKSAVLQIGSKGPVPPPENEKPKQLEEFMALVDNEMCTLTKDACFPESVVFLNVAEHDSRFWTMFGCLIKNLDLMTVLFPSPKDFCEAIFHSCPNLEKLELSNVQLLEVDGPRSSFPDDDFLTEEVSNANEDANDYPKRGNQVVNTNLKHLEVINLYDEWFHSSLFKRLFNIFPNLEALHVQVFRCSSPIFLAFKDWLNGGDGRGDKLKELGFSFYDLDNANETVESLTSGKLRLEKLDLWNCKRRHVNAARTLLEGHAATLKKLAFHGTGDYEEWDPIFPLSDDKVLGGVEELELYCVRLESNDLWKCVPNLKKLVLDFTRLSHTVSVVSIQELRDVALISCVEVELEDCFINEVDGDDEDYIARKLAALLPNVRKLKLQDSTTDVFAIACEAFPKLVELVIAYDEQSEQFLDSTITGLNGDLVEKINREGKMGDWKPESDPRAGLAKLEDLEVLSIRCRQGLGYSSAVSGIQRLPRLQQLQLDFQEVDGEVWNELWKPLLAQFPWRED